MHQLAPLTWRHNLFGGSFNWKEKYSSANLLTIVNNWNFFSVVDESRQVFKSVFVGQVFVRNFNESNFTLIRVVVDFFQVKNRFVALFAFVSVCVVEGKFNYWMRWVTSFTSHSILITLNSCLVWMVPPPKLRYLLIWYKCYVSLGIIYEVAMPWHSCFIQKEPWLTMLLTLHCVSLSPRKPFFLSLKNN